jgi:sugar-phosphatase
MSRNFLADAIVFDLDGVLVDSMPAIRATWSEWARERGLASDAVLGAIHLTAEELVHRFAPALDAAAEARAIARRQIGYETAVAALDGSRELVQRLPQQSWAVVTSGRRELALRHLALGGLPRPEVLVTAEDTPRGKPDPAGYLLAASRLAVEARRCIAVEDSPAGVRAARSAGMIVFAMTSTHRASDLAEAHAVLESLAQIAVTVEPSGALSVCIDP